VRKFIKYFFLLLFVSLTVYYFYPEPKIANNVKIDRILVLKSKRQLQAFSNGKLVKTYTISLGRNPIGDKEFEGDKRTPEGHYTINDKNPNSGYYKNLGVSYPNQKDIEEANKIDKPTGGQIKIHGLKNGIGFIGKFQRWFDWTAGCMALTNSEIDELYNHTTIGTPIEIRP
jgi:murein L,D-transpeptidase YafK